jgi:hypothetical protein
MVHIFFIIIIVKGFNIMILTTFICEREKRTNQNNVNISNEGFLNLPPKM